MGRAEADHQAGRRATTSTTTPGAAGYYSYFEHAAEQPGYYVFEVGGWRVYVLNCNCDKMDCGTENQWFNQQLRDHPAACTLMAMHHPRYSSGCEHGSSTAPRPFWRTAYQHRVDLALAGHDHDYERFARMDAEGVHRTKGIVVVRLRHRRQEPLPPGPEAGELPVLPGQASSAC